MALAEKQLEMSEVQERTSQLRDTATRVQAGLKARYRAERRFRVFGASAIAIALMALALLFISIIGAGYSAFWQNTLTLEVSVASDVVAPNGDLSEKALRGANYLALIKRAMRQLVPEAKTKGEQSDLIEIVSDGAAYELQDRVMENPGLIGQTVTLHVPVSANFDMLAKGKISREIPETERKINDRQIAWFDSLVERGLVEARFNTSLFANSDSRKPELAGIRGAAVGSFLALLVALVLSFPIGIAAAVYLEEYARKNFWTDLIEVNINNLAAVPSIIFGLLGVALYVQVAGMPRGSALVGGLVLALMNLPVIIITGRAALKSVPPSIREAALGMGASKLQVIFHHVLPLAMPGMLTGAIISMARALGETAPLLMIGMVAFVADVPGGFRDAATALPVQIYLWADSSERAFVERTSAAIIVLLVFLILMNAAAVLLRKKFERRW